MPIVNVLLWAVLLGAAWVGYQLINFYNQAEEEANRKISSCYQRERQQHISQFDIRIGSKTVYSAVNPKHRSEFMVIGDSTIRESEQYVDYRLPSYDLLTVNDIKNEMAADSDCQSCA